MATRIVTKSGSGAPTTDDLIAGELAVDLTNGRLYTEDSGGTVLELGLNPSGNVDVTGSVTAHKVEIGDGSAGGTSEILFSDNVSARGKILYDHSSSPETMLLQTTGTTAISIDNSQNISIPNGNLDVTGTVTADGLTVSGDLSLTGVATIGADAGGEANVLTLKGRTSDNDAYIKFTSSDGATSYAYAGVSSANTLAFYTNGFTKRLDIGSGGDISFYEDTGTTPKFFWDSSAESLGIGTTLPTNGKLVIEESGTSVGSTIRLIGTNTSGSASQVSHITSYQPAGGAAEASALDFKVRGGDAYATPSTVMTLLGGGNVGIGTSSPNTKFHVSSAATTKSVVETTGTTSDALIEFTKGQGSGNTWSMGIDHSNSSAFSLAYLSNGSPSLTTHGLLTVDTSGKVGIGVTDPIYSLEVQGQAGIELFSSTTSGKVLNFRPSLGDANKYNMSISGYDHSGGGVGPADGLSINGFDGVSIATGSQTARQERLRIDASGNVKIGTATDRFSFLTASTANLQIDGGVVFEPSSGNNVEIFNYRSTDMLFGNGAAEDMRLDASGNLLVGKSSVSFATAGIELKNSNVISITRSANPVLNANRIGSSAGSLIIMHYDGVDVGSIDVTASATSYTTSSDQRLKENIADADDAGSKIDAIQVRKFDWKVDGSHQDYGMVAQELLEVAPEAVSAPEDPEEMMGVDYSKLVPMMLKEIQSLRARIAALES